jgi:hypothetical protein
MALYEELRRQVESESADGLALVADIRDNSIGTLALDPEVPCISIAWRGYATSLQMRYIHEVMLLLMENHRIGKILADNTKLPALGEEDRRWIATDWMPRAIAAGLRVTAATEPSSVFAREPLRNLVDAVTPGLVVRFFDRHEDARTWLKAYLP